MRTLTFVLTLCISVFGQSNLSIGGDNSFNNNNGNIKIQQSNTITNSEKDIDRKISKNIQETNILLGLLQEAKKINRIKTTSQDKERRCKNKIDALINIFGYHCRI